MRVLQKEKQWITIDFAGTPLAFNINTGLYYLQDKVTLWECASWSVWNQHTDCVDEQEPALRAWHVVLEKTYSLYFLQAYYAIVDKLINIGYVHDDMDYYNTHAIHEVYMLGVRRFLPYFAKRLAENPNVRLCDMLTPYRHSQVLKLLSLPADYQLTVDQVEVLFNKLEQFGANYRPYLREWLLRGYFQKAYDQEYMDEYACGNMIDDLFYFADSLGAKVTKKYFVQQARKLKLDYEIRENERYTEGLARYQSDMLYYENEDYFTIIPKTVEEFQAEAEYQSNCLVDYISQVADNNTNIVFVRNKNHPDEPYITCQVRELEIVQYLTRFNQHVENPEALQFQEEYAEFLKSLK